ncbi:toll/interleukin-1 receptor domain-containing protein [Parvularcula sp. IMCC14364]|uniref:toll/interleukin-1 receptor domain-containing protein n=1 Tax=Parvularcula sp. IMCC14364 TaxID=3067902 RepID=UPI00274155ED|nr:toll/interleukin-1 receptor domain-containing protein [Parvularcula sp. IMCC14364]
MADIFVAYARADRSRVQRVESELRDAGFTVFIDMDIAPGENWSRKLERQLDSAHCVLVVWSSVSITRNFVKDEAGRGLEREVLVPVMIDEITPPLGFGQIHTSDLTNWKGDPDDERWQQVIRRVDEIVSEQTGQAPRLPSQESQPVQAPVMAREAKKLEEIKTQTQSSYRRPGFLFKRLETEQIDLGEPGADYFFGNREYVNDHVYYTRNLTSENHKLPFFDSYRSAAKKEHREKFPLNEGIYKFLDRAEDIRNTNLWAAAVLISIPVLGYLLLFLNYGYIDYLLSDYIRLRIDQNIYMPVITLGAYLIPTWLYYSILTRFYNTSSDYNSSILNATWFRIISEFTTNLKYAIYKTDDASEADMGTQIKPDEASEDSADNAAWWTRIALWYGYRTDALTDYFSVTTFSFGSMVNTLKLLFLLAMITLLAMGGMWFVTAEAMDTIRGVLTYCTGAVLMIFMAWNAIKAIEVHGLARYSDILSDTESIQVNTYEEISGIVYRDKRRINEAKLISRRY